MKDGKIFERKNYLAHCENEMNVLRNISKAVETVHNAYNSMLLQQLFSALSLTQESRNFS